MAVTVKTESADAHGAVAPAHTINPAHARRAARALYLIVFISGAVLMGVEIAGAKVLAPGFGTSIFVWGSIISLFMGALAAGYYLGGSLADRKPSFGVLAAIVSTAGVLTALIPRFGPAVCDHIARQDAGPVFGPLAAAAAIFFLPSFLMGMVSPYAVKLNASSLTGLGSVAGRLYALSTFGSIVGTLLTTFVLIPRFFVPSVMQSLGLILILTAIVGFLLFRSATGGITSYARTAAGTFALLALLVGEAAIVFPVEAKTGTGERLLYYEDSSYHEILVTEPIMYADPDSEGQKAFDLIEPVNWEKHKNKYGDMSEWSVARWLKFNNNLESGIYPYIYAMPNAVGYTDLLHLPLIWVRAPKRILVLGGGGGIIPSQYYRWYGAQVDVLEIDPSVERTARRYFNIPDTAQVRFHIGDGRQELKRMPAGAFDVIVLDAYSSGGQIPSHLLTWEFMREVKTRLAPGGVLATNLISALRNVTRTEHPADLFLAEYKTLHASRAEAKRITPASPADSQPLFRTLYAFPKVYRSQPGSGEEFDEQHRNVILIATDDEVSKTQEQIKAALQELVDGPNPVIKAPDMLWHVDHMYGRPAQSDLDLVPVLCDDFAPVDMMYLPPMRYEVISRPY